MDMLKNKDIKINQYPNPLTSPKPLHLPLPLP